MLRQTNRRSFLRSASAGAALSMTAVSYGRVVGSNDRLSIAVIGCGSQGFRAHMHGLHRHAEAMNVEITAVVDPWRPQRERAAEQTRQWYGRAARQFVSYRDVVALDDVDAVTIASCDHQHEVHLLAAAEAKKDVYVEKPLGMDLEKVKTACDAVQSSGVVCQVGTQRRSTSTGASCRKLFRTGLFGQISRIEQCRNAARPYWYSRLAPADEKDVDWAEFLMHRPTRPFCPNQFTGWYGYRDFSDGPVPGLGSHFIDLMHYITGAKYPVSASCDGGTFTWDDHYGFTCPDQVQATWVYPEGFLVSYVTNFGSPAGNVWRFYGKQGVLDLTHWSRPTYTTGTESQAAAPGTGEPVELIEPDDHYLDWLKCIRSRGTCVAPIEAGYQHAVAVLMAVKAFDEGKRQIYDADQRAIVPA